MPHRTHSGCLEEKFAAIKGGKGIAFAVPLSSVIGVNNYRFLSNYRQGKIEEKKQEAEA